MEATGHIQILLRDRRRILSVRRANVRHEVWLVDLRRLPGNKPSLSTFLSPFYDEKIPFHVSKKRFRSKKISKKGKINTSRFALAVKKKRKEKLFSFFLHSNVSPNYISMWKKVRQNDSD